MKGIFLFCTKLKVYLIELPLVIMLGLAIHYNGDSTETFRFYPLIIMLALGILFIAVYFFRGVYITSDEISDVGFFSARESELIKKNSTVMITVRGKGKLNVDVWSHSDEPAFDWMKKDSDVTRDVRIYHSVALGGKKTAAKILSFFGVDEASAAEFAVTDGVDITDQKIRVTTEKKHDTFEIKIKFLIAPV